MAAPQQGQIVPDQYSGSVNQNVGPPVTTSGGNLEDGNTRLRNILGTMVDTGPQPFPTVPSSFDANRHYYPGLARSYVTAGLVETPSHRQIQYATQDIPSIQLTVRGAIAPEVIQRWQLSQVSTGTILPTG